ncbi:MAG: F0F1 ATP synthase subunit B [Planctomycetes bacterium]|nr:F0F1 ATP synthase subunit B [Planctomycetota bacterium]
MQRTALAIVSLLLLALAPAALAQGHNETPADTQSMQTAGETHAETAQAEDHAADAGHEKGELLAPIKQGLPAMITAFVVFIIVFLVLKAKAWPVIAGGLDERSQKIRDEIAAAESAREDAKVALAGYEKSLIEARSESKKILDETKVYQLQLAAELKAKADVELARMKDRARRDIESAKKIAISEIYAEATNLATIMAGKILRRQVTEQDHARLMEESLSELSKMNN